MTHKQHYNIYIASCEADGGIYRYTLNNSGEFTFVEKTVLNKPMYMLAKDNKMHIVLRSPFNGEESGYVAYNIDEKGSLVNPGETLSTKGEVVCHLEVTDEAVYCVNYTSGSVIKMPDKLSLHKGKSIHPTRQSAPHTHFISQSYDGKYLLVCDLGLDKIFVYNKDLSLKSQVDLPAGSGPRHLAFHPDGENVFCANELNSTVSHLKYKNGKLTHIGQVSTVDKGFNSENFPAAIRCTGDVVYVSNRGHNSIAQLEFGTEGTKLKSLIPTYGSEPRDFIELGDMLVITNQFSHNVTAVNKFDGKKMGEVSVKSPLCVINYE